MAHIYSLFVRILHIHSPYIYIFIYRHSNLITIIFPKEYPNDMMTNNNYLMDPVIRISTPEIHRVNNRRRFFSPLNNRPDLDLVIKYIIIVTSS